MVSLAITEIERPIALSQRPEPSGHPEREPATRARPGRSGGSANLPYFAALDGVRGLAVISVLFFHMGFSWAVGGYLGVSTFFTLSGFLITSLLLAEKNATGHIALRAFWVRRFRRLMPAAIAAMVLALVVAVVGDPVARANIGGDIGACITYVANWRFVLSGKSYSELFSTPSAVQHFWSLAIEEQFYLIYPLVAFAVLKVARGSRALFGVLLGLCTLASVLAPLWLGFSHDRIYYGTDARAAELLMGGMLAVALYYRPITDGLARSARVQFTMATLGAVSLVICVVIWARVDQQSDPLYAGGFLAYSILSVLVILAALLPVGPVKVLLSTPPLRWMGKISYGVYLYHWPIYLAVSEDRVPVSGLALFALRVCLTLAVATVSFRYLETPIRKGQPLLSRGLRIRPVRLAPVALTMLAVAAVIAGITAPPPVIDFARAQQELKFSDAPPPVFDPNASTPPRPRMAMFGDSTALETAMGLNQYLAESGKGDLVGGVTELGCSLIRGGFLMDYNGVGKNQTRCNQWDKTFAAEVARAKPNIAIIQDGPWEVVSHQFPDEPQKWYTIGQQRFDDYLTKEMLEVIDLMASHGAQVYWMTLPKMGAPKGKDARKFRGDAADPARAKRFNEIVSGLPSLRPGKVRVVDVADWLEKSGEDERLRPDGVHFSPATAREVSERWLFGTVTGLFDEDWIAARHAEFEARQAGLVTPVRALVVGDSAAFSLGMGLGMFGDSTKTIKVGVEAQIGCGIGRGGARKNHDRNEAVPKECQAWETDWPKKIDRDKPDLSIVVSAMWDATDRQLDGDSTWRGPGDATYDAYLTREYARAADVLHSRGGPVMWLTYPPIDVGRDEKPDRDYAVDDPARMARVNDIVRSVARTRPWMKVADFADYANRFPGGQLDAQMRPDGVHLTADTAQAVSRDWLARQILDFVRDYRAAIAAAAGAPPVPVPSLPPS